MASRSLDDLQPAFARKVRAMLAQAEKEGLDLLVYCTFRSLEEQARLYRQSRSTLKIHGMADHLSMDYGRRDLAKILLDVGPQYGPHVTDSAPGMSIHYYREAIDSVPVRDGKLVWGTEDENDWALWEHYGDLLVRHDMEWAGNWTNRFEYAHGQDPDADWRELIRPEAQAHA